jgi:F-type H+-transporting ATPase subunit b
MDLNLTLLGQMLTFIVFVWFTMKYVWPPMDQALKERQQKIADGLAAAEQGERDLAQAEHKVSDMLRESKIQASQIIDEAVKRASHVMEEAKEAARLDGARIKANAQTEVDQQVQLAKEKLRQHVGHVAILAAEKILVRSIDPEKHADLIEQAAREI